ncbi:MAG: MASE1 domain-containing protein [Chiayiivirga sp.]|jgi:two-component system sensor histidine kinase UhpB|nr:MASE1 domain-containing protein [Chiayiivirga sp.]
MSDTLARDSEVMVDAQAAQSWREAFGVVVYGVAWALAFFVSTYYWFLPAGVRFACLWWAPRRLWGWLALSEFAAILVVVLLADQGYRTWLGFVLGVFMPWAVHAGVVAMAQRGESHRLPDTPWRMARLLLAMVVAATLTAGVLTLMSVVEGGAVSQRDKVLPIAFAIGDFIGMLIVTPIWLHLASARRGVLRLRPILELLFLFVPMLAVLALVPDLRPLAAGYAAVLALVPMVLVVFRHGWEGGGWALALTSLAVYLLGEAFDARVARDLMQTFLAIAGAVCLMLGAAVRALRNARDALSERNAALAAQTLEMRALGERLVRAQEDEQRRLAQDLQGELEQGMTALGTRLGLLARTTLEPSQLAAIDSLRGLTRDIHASMREALLRLRPLLLDRQGLEATLRTGPIRELLADAGVRYDVVVRGPAMRLDADVQGALYRICQETATDCVRRMRGRHYALELKVEEGAISGAAPSVQLRVSYDGAFRSETREVMLPATRDRVQALGGEYCCEFATGSIEHSIRVPGAPAR